VPVPPEPTPALSTPALEPQPVMMTALKRHTAVNCQKDLCLSEYAEFILDFPLMSFYENDGQPGFPELVWKLMPYR